jgi:ribonuclease E
MPQGKMLINYVPGEECRVAIVENGQLEEYHAEPTNAVSRVGNIYLGKVTNVEAGIQAAFVDFGVEEAGFLHVSDLHPQYFPGEDEDTTERVGKKTPRRSRPPMQQALRRGQEIIVQVLKEGIGTKGPTLTSYLSIPGRFLVMMPQMDRVGVSRKVEDEDQRAEMREILDALDLPDGFGFILRTAGFNRTKTELKRDLAYLLRLWKDMEHRRSHGRGAKLLYSESDLLVRSLRDLLGTDIDEVIIDNEMALRRAARFMKIVAPRSQAKLRHYKGHAPIYHAFGITEQVRTIHSRDVPLPSGGRLVIDETEALVAIDVNSGKMRSARDAETNAYQVNLEAVDVICRQLRLRDLGGLVINDLIDMRSPQHRKDIENRFKERLKKDRARTTILPISAFGILEMTRQRMRGSHESVHFAGCQSCRGRGVVQKPDSVAADALQDLAALLDHDKVAKVEMVVNPRVAGALLSTRRAALTRIEHLSGKGVEVRISDAIGSDRVAFYAYDGAGADVDLEKLPRKSKQPELIDWQSHDDPAEDGWAVDLRAEAEDIAEQTAEAFAEAQASLEERQHDLTLPVADLDDLDDDDDAPARDADTGETRRKKRRRRRRRRGEGEADNARDNQPAPAQSAPAASAAAPSAQSTDDGSTHDGDDSGMPTEGIAGPTRKKKRRRRRKSAGAATGETRESAPTAPAAAADPAPQPAGDDAQPHDQDAEQPRKKRRRRRRGGSRASGESHAGESVGQETDGKQADDRVQRDAEPHDDAPVRKKRPSRARSIPDAPPAAAPPPPAAEPKPRRSLYGASRRKLAPSEKARLGEE